MLTLSKLANLSGGGMGITSASKLLAIGPVKRVKLASLTGSTIAIDMQTYCHSAFQRRQIRAWYARISLFVQTIVNYNIKVVCVFDGKRPLEKYCSPERKYYIESLVNKGAADVLWDICYNSPKSSTRPFSDTAVNLVELYEYVVKYKLPKNPRDLGSMKTCDEFIRQYSEYKRLKPKIKIYPNRQERSAMIQFLSKTNIPNCDIVIARGDAESLCCALQKVGCADYVLSEDSDVFAYGATRVLRKLDFKQMTVDYIEQETVLKVYGNPTFEDFQTVCFLLGTDYNRKGLGVSANALLKALGDADKTLLKNFEKMYSETKKPSLNKLRSLFIPDLSVAAATSLKNDNHTVISRVRLRHDQRLETNLQHLLVRYCNDGLYPGRQTA